MKEIWIKFSNRDEYLKCEEKLFSLLDEAPGYNSVVVFITDKRKLKRLYGYDFDELQIDLLKNVFGEENVRTKEGKDTAVYAESRYIPKITQIVPCDFDMFAIMKEMRMYSPIYVPCAVHAIRKFMLIMAANGRKLLSITQIHNL